MEVWLDNGAEGKSIREFDSFMKNYNFWQTSEGEKRISDFTKILNGAEDEDPENRFSWLGINEGDFKHKRTNLMEHYGIPNSVHGQVEESSVFLCLTNPNIDQRLSLTNFYMDGSSNPDPSLRIENAREEEFVKEHIISDRSAFTEELKKLSENDEFTRLGSKSKKMNWLKDKSNEDHFYYLFHYYKGFLKGKEKVSMIQTMREILVKKDLLNKTIQGSRNISNLENYPFRSANPNYSIRDLFNKETLLTSRIVIWKVANWLLYDGKIKNRPIFIFRKFNDIWEKTLDKVLRDDLRFDDQDIEKLYGKCLENGQESLFYYIQSKGHRGQGSHLKLSYIKEGEEKFAGDETYKELRSRLGLDEIAEQL